MKIIDEGIIKNNIFIQIKIETTIYLYQCQIGKKYSDFMLIVNNTHLVWKHYY